MPNTESAKKIRLVLQFYVEDDMGPLKKEVIVDVDPATHSNSHTPSPYLVINHLTAAILKLLGGTPLVSDQEASETTQHGHESPVNAKMFTPRELEVLSCLLTGATNPEISERLNISHNTVKFHVKNILDKLHVKNRVELAVKYKSLDTDNN
ncbi:MULTISPECIES: response regulator transcription factor [Alicyclobacillus]|uniref:Helix-turn-helix transcriptional regulator n=1 Tax=Alicyclobacillus acidoterrestris (strain ATCC 49025 / DSM 3922 / CIP 106132 / NCIMB 13137 / GD3B) TaxID=1356854 RepID=T0CXX7_ALIAG|nr:MULTISPECIES: helix-turn-helix transcriptional regulator [Alicyclobacillus]EPZ42371.1 hypothetical protein N007_15135 [Alicyclobacillus acidoterrestris ATCC 49025]UNO50498.1 helix-turn-helix transcriptional regulator [Alicyclobacillus acidoterrestris]